MDDNGDRFRELGFGLLAVFGLLTKVLGGLPVPIGIPALQIEEDDEPNIAEVLRALDWARLVLIGDQPISDDARTLLRRAVLDWMTAYDLASIIQNNGAAGHRLDALNFTLDRIVLYAREAAEILGIDPR